MTTKPEKNEGSAITNNIPLSDSDDFKFEDFILTNYNPQSYIKTKLLR